MMPANTLIHRWARVGVMFNVETQPLNVPLHRSPDLERLLLDSARGMPENARLLAMGATWLKMYAELVGRHRLKILIERELEIEAQPALGLLLETGNAHRFESVLAKLVPAAVSAPLYTIQARNKALAARAERRASEVSRRWGVWAGEFEPKFDALRPPHWVMQNNPTYLMRADFRGDLRASVLASLLHDEQARRSETALAKSVGATRKATREAVQNLELTGKIERVPEARRMRIEPVVGLTA